MKLGLRGWQEILDRNGVQFLVLEHDLYQQDRGFSNLIDQVPKTAGWQVVMKEPVFVARRMGDRANATPPDLP